MSLDAGPYISEDYGTIYLPVGRLTMAQARREAARWAREFIGSDGRQRYLGQSDVPLHDHEDWPGCEACPARRAYVFEVYEA